MNVDWHAVEADDGKKVIVDWHAVGAVVDGGRSSCLE